MLVLLKRNRLVLVLDEVAVERMRRGDPVQLSCKDVGLENGPNITIGFGDSPEFMAMVQRNDIRAAIDYIYRGFEFRPDLGDHDDGPRPLTETN
jgi:hypothetical protein